MLDIKKSMLQITALEELTNKNTPIHRLQPLVKLITTVIYLIIVISHSSNQVSNLVPYIIYPVLLMVIGEIPFGPLFKRLLIALPFTFFTGISNVIINREVIIYVWEIGITEGIISFFSILLKTVLTVMAVLILVSTTNMNDLIYAMICLKIPTIIVMQIMMTYRYIHVLLKEVSGMYRAYILRAPKEKGIKLKDMGPFLGQLILRSFERADRIYNAMKCRGFEGHILFSKKEKISSKGWIYITTISSLLILMRFINISELAGRLFIS